MFNQLQYLYAWHSSVVQVLIDFRVAVADGSVWLDVEKQPDKLATAIVIRKKYT